MKGLGWLLRAARAHGTIHLFQLVQDRRFLGPSHWAPQIFWSDSCKVYFIETCHGDIKKLVRFELLNLARSATLEHLHIWALAHHCFRRVVRNSKSTICAWVSRCKVLNCYATTKKWIVGNIHNLIQSLRAFRQGCVMVRGAGWLICP